jgi:hypothetical protein
MKKFTTDAELIQHLFETRKKALLLMADLLPFAYTDLTPRGKKAYRAGYNYLVDMAYEASKRK